ncbi:Os08g0267450 [Oryza sativa Japonica Group]|uniref:Os08g0267450 protein n=1 Tax=Oryza sativa subsp. japonica TaxID=39947 RepID=A0A0P0XDX0_ORYSJ|nr:Os08g0267450 [Oryza sativa Japonica Group]
MDPSRILQDKIDSAAWTKQVSTPYPSKSYSTICQVLVTWSQNLISCVTYLHFSFTYLYRPEATQGSQESELSHSECKLDTGWSKAGKENANGSSN